MYNSVSNYQILQRDSSTNSAHVRVNDQTLTFPTGGPYTINGSYDIYVGDIWILAGQSNMRGHGFLNDPFTHAPHTRPPIPSVHLFNSREEWCVAQDPMHQLFQSPRQVHHTLPDPTVRQPSILAYRGASLGLSFAQTYQALNDNVPVGLVASAHGGTTLENWKRPDKVDEETVNTTLYGAMMDRIEKVGDIAGILWYQGESDTESPDRSMTYGERFKQWIKVLRQDVGKDTLPFAFVQIGQHRVDTPVMVDGWMQVQDAQRKLFEDDPYTAGIASVDCGLDDRLHLSADGLEIVGKRLAMAANEAKQGKGTSATPLPLSATFQSSYIPDVKIPSVLIEFKHMELIEWKNEQDIFGFEVVCDDPRVTLLCAKVDKDRKSIRLYLSDHSKEGSRLEITYGMNQRAINLIATNGSTLPAFKGLFVVQ